MLGLDGHLERGYLSHGQPSRSAVLSPDWRSIVKVAFTLPEGSHIPPFYPTAGTDAGPALNLACMLEPPAAPNTGMENPLWHRG